MNKSKRFQNLVLILFGISIVMFIAIWFRGNQNQEREGPHPQAQNEVSYVEVIASGGTIKHKIRIEIIDYAEPVLIDYPAIAPASEHLSDEVLSAYLETCNLISTNYDTFVSRTTKAFREFSRLESRPDFEREVNSTKRLAAERGIDTSTKSAFLYRVFVSGDFGRICYLVGLPPFTDQDTSSVNESNLTYTPMAYEDGRWKFESPHRFRELGLIYLDYKDRAFLRKLAASQRAFLDSKGEKVERME